jgi:RNA polymerase sigma-70 factor (ECF subfamily)
MRSTPPQDDLLAALPHLRRYAAVLTGDENEADSLVIETLEQGRERSLLEAAHANLQTRLFALMHELHRDRAVVQPERATADPAAAASSGPEKASGLLTHFRGLPAEEREILLLVAVERMRYDEIAAVLRVPVSTVIARLKRARDCMHRADISSLQNEQRGG